MADYLVPALWVSNRIFWGAQSGVVRASANGNGRSLGALMLAPVIVAPLTWRIGMTASAIERAGAVSLRNESPAFGRAIRKHLKRDETRTS